MMIGFFSESAMAFNAMPRPQVLARAPIPISLNSTTLRIAVKNAAATVPEASPEAGVAGTTGLAFVSLTGRWPLLSRGQRRGLQRARCRAIHHRVFYKYKKLGFMRA